VHAIVRLDARLPEAAGEGLPCMKRAFRGAWWLLWSDCDYYVDLLRVAAVLGAKGSLLVIIRSNGTAYWTLLHTSPSFISTKTPAGGGWHLLVAELTRARQLDGVPCFVAEVSRETPSGCQSGCQGPTLGCTWPAAEGLLIGVDRDAARFTKPNAPVVASPANSRCSALCRQHSCAGFCFMILP
jgi:hypothetical protein